MSYNSSFLSPSGPTQRERDAERALAEQRWESARRAYKWASFFVVVAMVIIATPQFGLGAWTWHIVGGTGLVVTLLAIVMMVKGSVGNGLISLVFAWGILPGWVFAAPKVVQVAYDQYKVIEKEWQRTMGKPEAKPQEAATAAEEKAKPQTADASAAPVPAAQ